MRIPGTIAIVTGGAGGIGEATAKRLASEGAAVVVSDIAAERAAAVASEIVADGGKALAWPADVSKSDDVRALVDKTLSRFGGVDILVNNAGGSANLLKRLSLFEHSDEEVYDWVVDLILFLVSDEADFITGENIVIDGGRSLGPKTQALDKLPKRKPRGAEQ